MFSCCNLKMPDETIRRRKGNDSTVQSETKGDSAEDEEMSSSGESEEDENLPPPVPPVEPPLHEVGIVEAPDWPTGISEIQERDYGLALPKRLFAIGPMVALAIIFYVGTVTVYMHTMWWPLATIGSFIHFFIFLSWNYATLNNFILAAKVGGGYVPKKWKIDPEVEIKGDISKRLQWCRICDGYKPPRSHHCSKCGRCVLKMDHHCLWINNCVGHRNHAFFVRFLIAAIIGCAHATIILGMSIYHAIHIGWYLRFGDGTDPIIEMTITSLLVTVAALALALGVTVALSALLLFQARYIRNNKTGVEEYIFDKARSRMKEEKYRGTIFVYPYEIGWRRNIAEVLANFKGKQSGNGVWWPIRGDCTQFTFSEEQLRQKKLKRSHARFVRITKSSRGGYCGAIRAAPIACICQPLSDQPRMEIKEGETWIVTGGNKRWLYGFKQGSDAKGWLPRSCTEFLPERPHLE
ncbi:unnamed protein product, partial [Mesorhabditis belari]|uniref:Palmitoyltransferase n=1 Tax=Mesorhabditis belari TaxID=2138241 RepID=A0AAF3FHP4_9BILA